MFIKVIDSALDYKEAIKISCDVLVRENIVEERYFNSIIDKIDEFGPYFCIAEGVAMPHARPEDGSIETDVSIVKLKNPVNFLGKEIKIFFTLSAKDSESHLGLLRQIADVCMNKDKLETILNSNNEKEIMEVF